jgi:hypothetical protein
MDLKDDVIHIFICLFVLFFETGFAYIAKAGLK